MGLQWFLKSEEVPMHSSELLMSLQSALLFTAVLCSCVTDLHTMALLRLNWNSADFPGTTFTSLLIMFYATASST